MWVKQGIKETCELVECTPAQDNPMVGAKGQRLMWDHDVLLKDLRGDVYEVYTHFDKDCSQFTQRYFAEGHATMVIAGTRVFIEGMSLKEQGVAGMRLELRLKMHRGTGHSQLWVALAIFRVQKYVPWRRYLARAPATAGALPRATENIFRRVNGDVAMLLAGVAKICSGKMPDSPLAPFGGF